MVAPAVLPFSAGSNTHRSSRTCRSSTHTPPTSVIPSFRFLLKLRSRRRRSGSRTRTYSPKSTTATPQFAFFAAAFAKVPISSFACLYCCDSTNRNLNLRLSEQRADHGTVNVRINVSPSTWGSSGHAWLPSPQYSGSAESTVGCGSPTARGYHTFPRSGFYPQSATYPPSCLSG